MFQLKTLSNEAIPRSLEKAERYRLLNEPVEAESICLDILAIDPEHQAALVILLLALTDQFDRYLGVALSQAREIIPRLHHEYDRLYYSGIICERRAKAWLSHNSPGSASAAYDWFREAMSWYEKAQAICSEGNDDPALRWNTCARIIMRNPRLRPTSHEKVEHSLE